MNPNHTTQHYSKRKREDQTGSEGPVPDSPEISDPTPKRRRIHQSGIGGLSVDSEPPIFAGSHSQAPPTTTNNAANRIEHVKTLSKDNEQVLSYRNCAVEKGIQAAKELHKKGNYQEALAMMKLLEKEVPQPRTAALISEWESFNAFTLQQTTIEQRVEVISEMLADFAPGKNPIGRTEAIDMDNDGTKGKPLMLKVDVVSENIADCASGKESIDRTEAINPENGGMKAKPPMLKVKDVTDYASGKEPIGRTEAIDKENDGTEPKPPMTKANDVSDVAEYASGKHLKGRTEAIDLENSGGKGKALTRKVEVVLEDGVADCAAGNESIGRTEAINLENDGTEVERTMPKTPPIMRQYLDVPAPYSAPRFDYSRASEEEIKEHKRKIAKNCRIRRARAKGRTPHLNRRSKNPDKATKAANRKRLREWQLNENKKRAFDTVKEIMAGSDQQKTKRQRCDEKQKSKREISADKEKTAVCSKILDSV